MIGGVITPATAAPAHKALAKTMVGQRAQRRSVILVLPSTAVARILDHAHAERQAPGGLAKAD
jgi:hypothetical protein